MPDPLYTVIFRASDGRIFTFQGGGEDALVALCNCAQRYLSSANVTAEFAGSEVKNLPGINRDHLTITPMNDLRNVWHFYGAIGDDMISGEVVLTA